MFARLGIDITMIIQVVTFGCLLAVSMGSPVLEESSSLSGDGDQRAPDKQKTFLTTGKGGEKDSRYRSDTSYYCSDFDEDLKLMLKTLAEKIRTRKGNRKGNCDCQFFVLLNDCETNTGDLSNNKYCSEGRNPGKTTLVEQGSTTEIMPNVSKQQGSTGSNIPTTTIESSKSEENNPTGSQPSKNKTVESESTESTETTPSINTGKGITGYNPNNNQSPDSVKTGTYNVPKSESTGKQLTITTETTSETPSSSTTETTSKTPSSSTTETTTTPTSSSKSDTPSTGTTTQTSSDGGKIKPPQPSGGGLLVEDIESEPSFDTKKTPTSSANANKVSSDERDNQIQCSCLLPPISDCLPSGSSYSESYKNNGFPSLSDLTNFTPKILNVIDIIFDDSRNKYTKNASATAILKCPHLR